MGSLLRQLSNGFVAGCVGTLVYYAALRAGLEFGLIKPPEPMLAVLTSKAFLYKQIVWGGVWGFLFVIPFFPGQWWLRGLIVGLAATATAIFYFMPAVPPVQVIVFALVLNMIFWGLSAAFWHDKVLKPRRR